MEFIPRTANECAGIVLIQNNDFYFRFTITQEDSSIVCLVKREKGEEITLAKQPIRAGRIYLKVLATGQAYSFYVATDYESWHPVAEDVDGRILSTTVAGGFVGAYIGMYASSNGQHSENVADWDWFEYFGSDVAQV
jgi:alpha-N-arabinofuranosidase